jgi:hypothetical protein
LSLAYSDKGIKKCPRESKPETHLRLGRFATGKNPLGTEGEAWMWTPGGKGVGKNGPPESKREWSEGKIKSGEGEREKNKLTAGVV